MEVNEIDPFINDGGRAAAAQSRHSKQADLLPAIDAFLERPPSCDDEPLPTRRRQHSVLMTAVYSVIPRGGYLSSGFNLASATLGASIISIPAAFRMCGIFTSIICLVCFAIGTIYSIKLLIRISERTGLKSFEELARQLLGRTADYIVAISMFLFCFGTMIAYVISMRDLILPFLYQNEHVSAYLQTGNGDRLLVSIVWVLGMLPLTFPKEINSLRFVSFFGVMSVCFFVICMVAHSATNGMKQRDLSTLHYFKTTGNDALVGMSVYMFAFLCQTNAFEVYGEMTDASIGKMTKSTGYSMGGCCLLYIIAGFFGYADFGDDIEDAILKNYHPRQDVQFAISYAGLAVKLCVAFALCAQPARDSMFYVFNWGHYQTVSTVRRVALCSIMSAGALVLGLYIPKITTVFGLLGSFCGSIIGFIFPALFVIYGGDWSVETVGIVDYISTWLLLLVGVIVLVFGTAASIYEMF